VDYINKPSQDEINIIADIVSELGLTSDAIDDYGNVYIVYPLTEKNAQILNKLKIKFVELTLPDLKVTHSDTFATLLHILVRHCKSAFKSLNKYDNEAMFGNLNVKNIRKKIISFQNKFQKMLDKMPKDARIEVRYIDNELRGKLRKLGISEDMEHKPTNHFLQQMGYLDLGATYLKMWAVAAQRLKPKLDRIGDLRINRGTILDIEDIQSQINWLVTDILDPETGSRLQNFIKNLRYRF
jgi:hypothetical protein